MCPPAVSQQALVVLQSSCFRPGFLRWMCYTGMVVMVMLIELFVSAELARHHVPPAAEPGRPAADGAAADGGERTTTADRSALCRTSVATRFAAQPRHLDPTTAAAAAAIFAAILATVCVSLFTAATTATSAAVPDVATTAATTSAVVDERLRRQQRPVREEEYAGVAPDGVRRVRRPADAPVDERLRRE